MKPMLPEDRELKDTAAQVSEHYRAGTQDEPPAKVDAAIRAAAHSEVAKPRQIRNWQIPASIAAMLVIGVSLVLVVRDNEPPPSLDHPVAEEAKLAEPAPSQLAMKTQPRAKTDLSREDRPSRERTARPDRKSVTRDEVASAPDKAQSGSPTQMPAAPASATSESPVGHEKPAIAESNQVLASKKSGASADASMDSSGADRALRKQEQPAAIPLPPNDWLKKIDRLLLAGKEAEARAEMLGFHKQFPQYPVPERMRAVLPPNP